MALRHLLAGFLVASVVSTLLVSAHYYLAMRLVVEPAWFEPVQSVLLIVIVVLAVTLVLGPLSERLLDRRLSRLVSWPASLWMGFMFLLMMLLLFSDLVLWVTGTAAEATSGHGHGSVASARLRALGVLALALVAGAIGILGARRPPTVQRIEHRLRRWPGELDGFRIVQISDLHFGAILGHRFAQDVVERCNALDPDLVAVTGDLADGGVRHLAGEVRPFTALRARHGVFFVLGNHDHYSGANRWAEVARTLGMQVLRNRRVSVGSNGTSFELAGVDDYRGGWFDGMREDLPRALEGANPERAVILLAHDPTTFKRASTMGVDLQLSGHTHGGQIWPFCHLVRLAVPFVAGPYQRNGSKLYVSRGTGFWGPPMRLFAPAEITEHVLMSLPD
jgi:predicted MPP superfamily phosphohydrolase